MKNPLSLARAFSLLLVAGITLFSFSGTGCESRSAEVILPQYVEKKRKEREDKAALAAEERKPAGTPSSFFPGQNTD